MKIYLLNAPFLPKFVRYGRWIGGVTRGGSLDYPIWLAYATGVLEKEGHKIKLVDAPAWNWGKEDVIYDIKRFKPDVIVIESNFSSLSNDIFIAKLLKDNVDNARVVSVGPPASQFADRILEKNGVDIVARFEYDFTIRDIADAFEDAKNFKNINGISYKENGKVIHNPDRDFISSEELDEMPFVSKVYKKHLNIKDYFLGHTLYPMVQIFTGR